MNHHQAMAKALEAAQQAIPHDVPVGALILKETETLAIAYNQREATHDPTAHAEILALQLAGQKLKNWRLSETTLYVTLEPCPMCASAIIQARVSSVIFGAWDPVMGACGSRYNLFAETPHIQVLGGVLEEACRTQLQEFFQERRTHPYLGSGETTPPT
jgi:tRNA(adenine34) deaminase